VSEDFGNDFITVTDDDGVEFVLEHLDTLELNGNVYMAFLPADVDEEDDDYGLVILKVVEENGEDILVTIDDDVLLEDIYGQFMERLLDEDE